MSQAADAGLRPQHVTIHMQNLASAQQSLLQSIKDAADTAIDAGMTCAGLKDAAKLAELRAELLQLATVQQEASSYARALGDLVGSYQPTATEATDFKDKLSAMMSSYGRGFKPEASDIVREFDSNVADADGAGGAAADEDMGEDDDLVMAGGDLLNTTCPISGKNVLDLDDAIEDDKGYVYSRAAILAHIRAAGGRGARGGGGGGGGGQVEAPFPGATHMVRADALRPSARVQRMQRRRRLGLGGGAGGTGGGAPTQGGGGGGGGGGAVTIDGDEVIDV